MKPLIWITLFTLTGCITTVPDTKSLPPEGFHCQAVEISKDDGYRFFRTYPNLWWKTYRGCEVHRNHIKWKEAVCECYY